MTRLLIGAALTATVFAVPSPANACYVDTCWFTRPACEAAHLDCSYPIVCTAPGSRPHVCF